MDRRNEKTKTALCNALVSLSKTVPYEMISVTALCRQANVSRSTFYLNYGNIYDLLEEMQADFIEGLSFDVTDYTFVKMDSERAMQYIMDNKDMFRFLWNHGALKRFFVSHISCMVQEIVFQKNTQDVKRACDVASTYLVNGSIAVMNYYFESDIKISAHDITDIIYDLIYESLPTVKKIFLPE